MRILQSLRDCQNGSHIDTSLTITSAEVSSTGRSMLCAHNSLWEMGLLSMLNLKISNIGVTVVVMVPDCDLRIQIKWS